MANIDPNYRKWQTLAARKIVEQLRDGTLEHTAEIGARVSNISTDEAMARQIVGIMLAHLAGE